MILIPAIDLLGGACVRLTRGRYDRVERYSEDPVEVDSRFEEMGAQWIHLVDLDAARVPSLPDASISRKSNQPAVVTDSPDHPAAADHNRPTIRRIARMLYCSI